MGKKNIQTGIINEKKLINLFATSSQKQKYISNGKFVSNNKNILLKEANRYCEIVDLGNRQYNILNLYKYPLPKNINKMQAGLYQYMIPLILSKLIDGHNENNKITFTSGKWARQIKMINHNYNAVKYHKKLTSDYFDYSYGDIDDFFDKADDMITRQLEQSLKYLEESGTIIWNKVNMVYKEKLDDKIVSVSTNHDVVMDKIEDTHVMTDEETSFYTKCIEIADKESGAEDKQSRYFGEHAKKFKEVLTRELLKENIKFVYQSYEVYYINLDKCKNLLQHFENINGDQFIENFNNEFQKMIIDNAENRYKKKSEQYELDNCIKKYSQDYIDTFKDLSDMTINNKTESVWDRLKIDKDESDYKLHIKTRQGKL